MKDEFLAWDGINGNHEFCDTIKDAQEQVKEFFSEDGMYHPDMDDCMILQVVEKVSHEVTDEKCNYKYASEDEAIEANDRGALENEDYWTYDIDCDEQWKCKFVKIIEDEK